MSIQVNDTIPNVTVQVITPEGAAPAETAELFKGKKVVLFGLPGAYTPTCSGNHVPGYVEKTDELRAKGVDEVLCLSVNDAFVMAAWEKDLGSGSKVTMIADGSAMFTKALGLELDLTEAGLGVRCDRCVMVVQDGKVEHLAIEAPQQFEVSSAEAVLSVL